jgi:PAS domain S-box-containing protein
MDRGMLERIRNLLRQHPRGLHIADISARLKTSRDLISKYLEILEVTGQVESRTLGSARVFSLTSRVPASALLDLSSDLVCTLDNRGSFLFANHRFLEFLGLTEKDLIGIHILDVRSDRLSEPALPVLFSDLLAGSEGVRELSCRREGNTCHLRVRGIPTVFEDGRRGMTVLMEDITKEREYVRDLEFLARTSTELADIGDDENIYQYIAERIAEIVPDSIVAITSIDMGTRIQKGAAVAGNPEMVRGLLSGLNITTAEEVVFTMDNTPGAVEFFSQRTLEEVANRLYIQLFKMYPEEVCDRIQEELSLGRNYAMGCVCRGGLYGAVDIRLRKGTELRDKETIEAFIRQAGVALQRRTIREKLREAEEMIHSLQEERAGM